MQKTKIAHEILAYLADHPDAQDTVEGIVEWWLQEQMIQHRMVEAKAALNYLVKKEFVIEKRSEGRPLVYCLNPEKVQKVRDIIDKDPSGSKASVAE